MQLPARNRGWFENAGKFKANPAIQHERDAWSYRTNAIPFPA
jgi:hypothetical protein